MTNLEDPLPLRLAQISRGIDRACHRSGREPASVRLMAVSKTFPEERVREAWRAGQRDFGENYLQEWQDKARRLEDCPDLRWHFIGHLQSRKARALVGKVALVHSVDRLELAQELGKRSAAAGVVTAILLQVNVGGEATKGGFSPEDTLAGLEEVVEIPGLELRGLMTLPPPGNHPEDSRPWFRLLHRLREQGQEALGRALPELSMGMSGDFEVAVEEGATWVRVGSALFGRRG